MLTIEFSNQFKRDYKLATKRGYDMAKLMDVISLLQNEATLPAEYRDHPLKGINKNIGVRECHIEPDWLLVYRIKNDKLILQLIRTGTHSDLF